jgi:hypothetical protein
MPMARFAQAGHDAWGVASADLGGVLGVGDVADVVQRFDAPVPADVVGKVFARDARRSLALLGIT